MRQIGNSPCTGLVIGQTVSLDVIQEFVPQHHLERNHQGFDNRLVYIDPNDHRVNRGFWVFTPLAWPAMESCDQKCDQTLPNHAHL